MSMHTNMNNVNTRGGDMGPPAGGPRGDGLKPPCSGEPVASGREADIIGGAEDPVSAQSVEHMGCNRPYLQSIPFCETFTLHESFDASCIKSDCARMAYDTRFLSYAAEPLTICAKLPCGGSCPVAAQRVSLTGAIPYVINVGPVSASCGSSINLSIQGSTMVDTVVGYACGGDDLNLNGFSCANIVPTMNVCVRPCGNGEKTNIMICGEFSLQNLPPIT